jgi:hypothetical protein
MIVDDDDDDDTDALMLAAMEAYDGVDAAPMATPARFVLPFC